MIRSTVAWYYVEPFCSRKQFNAPVGRAQYFRVPSLPVACATIRDGLCGIFSRWLWRRRTARKNAETNPKEILLRLSLDFLFMVSCTRNMVPLFVCRANLSRECLGKLQGLTIRSREPRSPGTVKSMVQSANRPQELRWGIWGLIYENKASHFYASCYSKIFYL